MVLPGEQRVRGELPKLSLQGKAEHSARGLGWGERVDIKGRFSVRGQHRPKAWSCGRECGVPER